MPQIAVDLDYDLEEDKGLLHQSLPHVFFLDRVQAVTREIVVQGLPGRVLDLGAGLAFQAVAFSKRGWESWGLEPSAAMLYHARRNARGSRADVALVQGVAESLPFPDDSFDRLLCQGSFDHFADPSASVSEIARVLKPQGRAIIAIANYDSLSCRLGKAIAHVAHTCGRSFPPEPYRYWVPPRTHTFRGDYQSVRKLGGSCLEMERCFGISLFWLFPYWAGLLERLPQSLADTLLRLVDRVAYRLPVLADMIITTWRPRKP